MCCYVVLIQILGTTILSMRSSKRRNNAPSGMRLNRGAMRNNNGVAIDSLSGPSEYAQHYFEAELYYRCVFGSFHFLVSALSFIMHSFCTE
mmetsp:Transcript_2280/g.3924  ORF Transcript_2280/g.3924 Transcript_2280/m.3924 type:complete len:91 (+) Transcript_2280:202-474(+)